MKESTKQEVSEKLSALRSHFKSIRNDPYQNRKRLLKKLRVAILSQQDALAEALFKDLRKSPQEAFITEIGLVIKEIDLHLKKLGKWSKVKSVRTPLYLLPSSSYLKHEPRGVVLIVAPWNYPFQLIMTPLIGAISAGNCVMLKPSEFSPNTNAAMEDIIREVFEPDHVAMVHGGKPTNQALFSEKFDMIFFTGSTMLGKVVAKAAAETLTPTVLELGGKSPCIVDESADLEVAAKKIAWGKTVNLGQTCIAPDYLLVHESIKAELTSKIIKNWQEFFGSDPQQSEFLPRMITSSAFDRVSSYLKQGNVIHGGVTDREDKYISPTLMEDVDLEGAIMTEEIFGPILPLVTFSNITEAIDFVNSKEEPLAYYYFGKSSNSEELLNKNTSGGACVNDVLIHISNHALPFGGVGPSGIGRYHGKYSFEAFSNQRALMKSPTWIDVPFQYPPFKYFSIAKRILS